MHSQLYMMKSCDEILIDVVSAKCARRQQQTLRHRRCKCEHNTNKHPIHQHHRNLVARLQSRNSNWQRSHRAGTNMKNHDWQCAPREKSSVVEHTEKKRDHGLSIFRYRKRATISISSEKQNPLTKFVEFCCDHSFAQRCENNGCDSKGIAHTAQSACFAYEWSEKRRRANGNVRGNSLASHAYFVYHEARSISSIQPKINKHQRHKCPL